MMMTWHTRFSFLRSAEDLSDEHLRAQIDDCADLVDMVLTGGKQTEPAYYMWKDHLCALLIAGMCASMEWTFHRGFDDKTFWKFSRLGDSMREKQEFSYVPPSWFRDEAVVMSHRSVLIGRYGETYASLWPSAPTGMPLLWVDPGSEVVGGVAGLRVSQADLPALRDSRLSVPTKYRDRIVNLP